MTRSQKRIFNQLLIFLIILILLLTIALLVRRRMEAAGAAEAEAFYVDAWNAARVDK